MAGSFKVMQKIDRLKRIDFWWVYSAKGWLIYGTFGISIVLKTIEIQTTLFVFIFASLCSRFFIVLKSRNYSKICKYTNTNSQKSPNTL